MSSFREIITAEELRDWLKVSERWVRRRIERGDLRPIKAGNLNRFYLDEVIEYVERTRKKEDA